MKIITLCGSTKFKKEFQEENIRLTLEGNIVITVALFGHADNIDLSVPTKTLLDRIHKHKIMIADSIFVINKDGYIGKSTKSEIEYAKSFNKEIVYMESISND